MPQFPDRYRQDWQAPFYAHVRERLWEGAEVLDIGSGRIPTVLPQDRPARVKYVGLDLSASELAEAGPGAYDETVVGSASDHVSSLDARFDLAVSWQVLEHVKPLPDAMSNVHQYLKPGGDFVALFSGSWSAFAVINRVLPDRIGLPLVAKLNSREQMNRPVFPAYYDRCWASALRRMLSAWSTVSLTPLYQGARYFNFSPRVQAAYLRYEDFAMRRGLENLATHYLLVATK